MAKLGLSMGLESGQYCKRQNRWMFIIDDIAGDFGPSTSTNVLPPSKAARPSIQFKEMPVNHLFEEVFYPAKPEWKPINLTLYDLKKDSHPIWDWLSEIYDPQFGAFNAPNTNPGPNTGLIRRCTLEMYDGCGAILESWVFEDCWPQSVDFQTLDYAQDGVMMCDITLRYARSYIDPTNGFGA